MLTLFVNLYLKLLLILTPFFVLTMFLSLTQDFLVTERHQIAVKVTLAVVTITFVLFFFGKYLFDIFGITLDAFRIGAGAVLFLSALSLIRGSAAEEGTNGNTHDVAVVPLAIPITVGPATIGALLVMGAGMKSWPEQLVACAALLASSLSVGGLLYLATPVERVLGRRGLTILTKLTGLFLSALAAQICFTGIKNFLEL